MKTKDIILEQANLLRRRLMNASSTSKGWCFETSVVLQRYLNKYGIDVNLVEGRVWLNSNIEGNKAFHYWCTYRNKIIDITGDQFNPSLDSKIPEVLYEDATNYPMYHQDSLGKTPAIIFGKWPILMMELLESDYEYYSVKYFQGA